MTTPMTQDYATLPAGRELDALVAERVMGAHWRRSSATGRRCLFFDAWPEWFTARADGSELLVGDDPFYKAPAYSTDIAAAWKVVEELARRGLFLWLRDMRQDSMWSAAGAAYEAVFQTRVQGISEETDESAPLAICRAALAAVGGP